MAKRTKKRYVYFKNGLYLSGKEEDKNKAEEPKVTKSLQSARIFHSKYIAFWINKGWTPVRIMIFEVNDD